MNARNTILVSLLAFVLVTGLAAPFFEWAACNRLEDYLITLRYARNAASGMGIVFSEGQYYQGFTSPLQFCTGYLLCLFADGVELVPTVICIVGLLCIVLFGVNLAFWIAGRLSLPALAASVCLVLSSELFMEFVAFDSVWALGFASTALSLALLKKYRAAGLLLGFAVLSRHDAILCAVLLVICLACRRRWRGILRIGFTAFLVTIPWYAFAVSYFGSPVPSSLDMKMEQGASGKARYGHEIAGAVEQPFQRFPLDSGFVLVGAAVLALVAVALWLKWRSPFRVPSSPLWLMVVWAVLHCTAYFALLKVPYQYPWYHVYSTAALLALIGVAPVMLAAWEKKRPAVLLGLAAAGFLYYGHLADHVPRHHPGRYRYAGYRAAAEWINRDAEASDIVRISEVGVFGWYCLLYIEDSGGITMPKVPLKESSFRYLVRAANPEEPVLPYVFHICELAAKFPNPGDHEILVYRRK